MLKDVAQVTEEDLNSGISEADDDVEEEVAPVSITEADECLSSPRVSLQPSSYYTAKTRQSVSAEAYGEWNKKKDFKAPVHPKTEEQKKRIQKILDNSFLFSCLDVEDLDVVLGAFSEESIPKGSVFIEQGADGFKMYLIESGEAAVYKRLGATAALAGSGSAEDGNKDGEAGKDSKDKQGSSDCKRADQEAAEGATSGADLTDAERALVAAGFKKVNLMRPGDAVGELALMYNAPRAASVVAATDLKLWALDRETFGHIVRDAASRKRAMFEEALREVPLLADMDPYERSKIADALKTATYAEGDVIIREGDEGDTFFLLLEGSAEAVKSGKAVYRYSKGGHFGELALLRSQPRAATVRATSVCRVAFMDRKSFKRLLGPVEAVLMRNQEHYRKVMQDLGLDTKYLDN